MTAQPLTATRIPRATFASMVTERLRESIVKGTVHEAPQRLIHEGLLRSEPRRRAVVPVLTGADVRDIYLHRRIASMIRESQTAEALALLKEHFDDAVVTMQSRDGDRTVEDRK